MPLGTLESNPPPFFRQGPSALSKLAVCSALAVFLMVADARFKVMQPMRIALAAVLYPVQWLAMQPVQPRHAPDPMQPPPLPPTAPLLAGPSK